MTDLKRPTDIVIQSHRPDGTAVEVPLTPEVWQHSLVRGPWKDAFAPIWDKHMQDQVAREAEIDQLASEYPAFRQQCRDFIQDLRTFGSNKGARSRLEGSGHEFYIFKPYFDDTIRDRLLALPTQAGTLESELRNLAQKRDGDTLCASHDLAPLLESVLNVRWDKARGAATLGPLPSVGTLSLRNKAKVVVKKGSQFLKDILAREGGDKRGGKAARG